ncbi:ABC transporter related [Acidimicrobium ferrooxidans DSM 10331]|uniref:ABC transporter related n=1 Tax=Acidimicrobium ferrooxidans (strain DSM 10331 / JCM 15462 / NBRC 103882 / ICP) TaxID=525909 RepID=C7M2E1_ACIFD|nr:ABC transporter ATP-binding protein [Acidimicrobium ferrooxidans]ACU54930.1 ABC transporter related [Acidimicrobium ferrooxidans DSM 10331]
MTKGGERSRPIATSVTEGSWAAVAPWLRRHRGKLAVTLLASAVSMGSLALVPVVQRAVIDGLGGRRAAIEALVLGLVGIGIVRFGTTLVRRFIGGRVAYDVQLDIRNEVYAHLVSLDLATHEGLEIGQLLSRVTTDLGLVQQVLAWAPMVLGAVLQAIVSIVIMSVLNVWLMLLALIVPVATFLASRTLRSTVFPSSWDAQQREGELTTVVTESIIGARVVRAFGQEASQIRRFVDGARALYASRLRNIRLRAWVTAELQAIPQLVQAGILALGGLLALNGDVTIGTFVAFASYLTQLAAPARMVAGILVVGQQARAGFERIDQLLSIEPGITEVPHPLPLPRDARRVSVRGVTALRGGTHEVLAGVDLEIAAGEMVAILGPSGSGKTTLCTLLPRLAEVSGGAVLVGGVDVRSVSLAELRRRVSMVFEESVLLAGTVVDNVRFGCPDASEAEVREACGRAGALEFIEALPDGFDTQIGEGGVTLSGGQRQRLALARALVMRPHVLVLDDATSAIDPTTEERIIASIRALPERPTVIVVSHRASVVSLVDRVVVLEQGCVVADGSVARVAAMSSWVRRFLDGGDGSDVEIEAVSPKRQIVEASGSGRRRLAAARSLGDVPPWVGELIAHLPPTRDEPQRPRWTQPPGEGRIRLGTFLSGWRFGLVLALALVAIDTASGVIGPLIVRSGIDGGMLAHSGITVVLAALGLLAVALIGWIDQWAETVQTGRVGESMLFELRLRLFSHLQRLGIDVFEREPSGRLVTRLTSDVETMSQLLQNGLVSAIVGIATVVVIAVVLVALEPRLALVALVAVPVLVVATVVYRAIAQRAYDRQREHVAAVNAHFQESIAGVQVVQALGQEEAGLATFRRLGIAYRNASLTALGVQAIYVALADLTSVVVTAGVLWVGSGLVRGHVIEVGVLVAFLLYITQLFAPVQQLAQTFDAYQRARAGLRKINSLLDEQPSIRSSPNASRPTRIRGSIELDRVWFAYPGVQRPALRDCSLAIPAGQHVAVVGETGAGKSTLMKLLVRFVDPSQGAVRLDGTDLRALDLAWFRSRVGYVPQEPFLFSGTIRDNITFGAPWASDDDVEAAARAVGAHDVIAALPDGYDQVVGERGRALAAGERQLVCLARAVLIDPAILLLDEATSNLDPELDARVHAGIERAGAGRTTVMIAHRLHSAERMDRIVVVGAGSILEDGTHDELLRRGGWYAQAQRATAAMAELHRRAVGE